jgi:hypothetical protein
MVINDLKSTQGSKETKTKEEEDDGSLYNLVRGKSTMMVQPLDEKDSENFVPQRRVVMTIYSEESSGDELVPIRKHKKEDQDSDKKNKKQNER